MAGIGAVHSVGDSIATFLTRTFPASVRDAINTTPTFQVVSSGQLAAEGADFSTGVTLYLYRVTVNEQLRNAHVRSHQRVGLPLSLDLHFMVTVWAGTPLVELTLLAWVMRQLHGHPLLDAGRLSPDGGWQPGEVVHVVPAELSNEDMMRIWDALAPAYRLSQTYVARVVQIDPEDAIEAAPVVARRLVVGDPEEVGGG